LRTHLKTTLNKPITVNPIITYSTANSNIVGPVQGGSLSLTYPTKQNALGTTYFGGGLTYINEHGGEIIDLPQGSRIYPSSKSDKMMNGSPTINVNVNIGGNIYGTERAADEIGDRVVEKIIDAVMAV
jgi:hypothetical protein